MAGLISSNGDYNIFGASFNRHRNAALEWLARRMPILRKMDNFLFCYRKNIK
jgi:5'(3')-deoxyribonucleotidase